MFFSAQVHVHQGNRKPAWQHRGRMRGRHRMADMRELAWSERKEPNPAMLGVLI